MVKKVVRINQNLVLAKRVVGAVALQKKVVMMVQSLVLAKLSPSAEINVDGYTLY